MSTLDSGAPAVTVRLWRADAVVLYDWLMSTDLNTVPITHNGQKQALTDLLGALIHDTDADLEGATADEIAAAQVEVAKDMGW